LWVVTATRTTSPSGTAAVGAPATGTPRLLRAINDRAALELLLEHGAMTRARLVELTGLSKPTTSQLLARLEADGLVVSVGTTTGGRGPNARLYAVNGSIANVAAVDIVPSRVTVSVADIAGRVLGSSTVQTPRNGGLDPVPFVRAGLRDAATASGVDPASLACVVMGIPGVEDSMRDSVAYASHLTGWSRDGSLLRLRSTLEVPVQLENDVNAAAVAERAEGAGQDAASFALLWVAAGLGLAIDLGGTLHRGATGGAGEIGYMPVPGAVRRRGAHERRGDFQDLVGAPAVLHLAREHGFAGRNAVTAIEHAHRAGRAGEPFFVELADRLATGLATIVAVLDPPLVVLAGDIPRAGGADLASRVERRLHRLSPLRPRVTVTGVDGNPVLTGALAIALAKVRAEIFAPIPASPTRGVERSWTGTGA
jgi:predicted NBD/HSP70 family sugar kinase